MIVFYLYAPQWAQRCPSIIIGSGVNVSDSRDYDGLSGVGRAVGMLIDNEQGLLIGEVF